MNFTSSKLSSLQAYHLLLTRKAMHPEFFGIEGRRRIVHGDYEFEAWIFRGGHALLFQHEGAYVTEIVTDRPDSLPERSIVTSLPCAGEKDHEESFGDRIEYITSVQTETLTDHLYSGTYSELLDHGRMCDGLMVQWRDEGNRLNLSMLDLQRHADEVHVQAYHLRSDCGLVLRTQTILKAGLTR